MILEKSKFCIDFLFSIVPNCDCAEEATVGN